MSEHPPTGEQAAILDAARSCEDLVIEAGAGTGKTSTLRMLAADRPRVRGLYLAYNKAIAVEAGAAFGVNVTCRTAHSVAFGSVGRRYAHRLTGPRMPGAETARRLGVTEPMDLGTDAQPVRPKHLGRLVMSTVERFCHSSDAMIAIRHVPAVAGYSTVAAEQLAVAVADLAAQAWADLTALDGELRFSHDVYLKLWQLAGPRLGYDVIMLDEAQDANPAIADVVERQHHSQRIAVGDRCQALYGWRGAVDAMSGWPWRRLWLTRSFRFGLAIAQEANRWLERLDAGLRLSGSPGIDSHLGMIAEPDAILCRTNAGTVAAALDELDAERSVAIVGGIEAMVSLARAAIDLRAGRGTDHPELFAFGDWEQLREYATEDPAGSDLRAFVRLIDTHGPYRVIELERSLCSREDQAEVIVSTAHKAKGREWPAVRIYQDFTPPQESADPAEPPRIPRADAMLAYVAVTRAREGLDRGSLRWLDDQPWRDARCPAPPPAAASRVGEPVAPREVADAVTDPHAWLMGTPT